MTNSVRAWLSQFPNRARLSLTRAFKERATSLSFDIVERKPSRNDPAAALLTGVGELTPARAFQLASLATSSVHYGLYGAVRTTCLDVSAWTWLTGENYCL